LFADTLAFTLSCVTRQFLKLLSKYFVSIVSFPEPVAAAGLKPYVDEQEFYPCVTASYYHRTIILLKACACKCLLPIKVRRMKK
jgi:hypothetical protein